MAALSPRTSPGSAIFRIWVLPSLDAHESLTCPLHTMMALVHGSSSLKSVAPRGRLTRIPMESKSRRTSGERLQNTRAERSGQLSQADRGVGMGEVVMGALPHNKRDVFEITLTLWTQTCCVVCRVPDKTREFFMNRSRRFVENLRGGRLGGPAMTRR